MAEFAHALSWMIISPIAVLTDVLAIVIIAHYYPFFHGTDVMLTSLLSAMALNVLLVLPIPSFLGLKEMDWNPSLCLGYAWCFITFRLAQILSLSGMSIHWSTMLKVSAEKKNYFSTKFLKLGTVFIWIISAIVGSLPLIGAVNNDFNDSNQCQFLASNLGVGFAIFFLVCIVASMFVALICAFDATFLIKHMKRVAEVKYNAGRFVVPENSTSMPTQGTCSISERYHRLNFAWDLSCFVLLVILLSFLGNHFPYAVIQGIQLFHQADRQVLETVTLWLVGLESLLLPHTLWFFSRRYRHALTYIWQVYLLRRKDVEEEDPTSCMLQSYTQKDKDRASMIPSRPHSTIGQNGGHISASGTLRSTRSEINPNKDYIHTNGRPGIATVTSAFTDISRDTAMPQNGIIQGEVHVETQYYRERGVDTPSGIETLKPARRSKTPERKEAEIVRQSYEQPGSSGAYKNDITVPSRQIVARTSSTSSKQEWKEQMKKKHLPPIFVNEAFDIEDHSSVTERREEARRALYQASSNSEQNTSLHYYMSSDYHPDYLTESLPRHKLTISTESDSTGIQEPYNDNDISEILDRSFERSSLRGSSKRESVISVEKIKPMPIIQRPYLRTFVSPSAVEREDSFGSGSNSGSDSSRLQTHRLREDREIVFDTGTIPLDDINDGYNGKVNDSNKSTSQVKLTVNVDSPHSQQGGRKGSTDLNPKSQQLTYMDQIRARTRSPIYNNVGVVETTTSFSKQQNDSSSIQNSLASTGSFIVSNINSSQSDTESNTFTPRTSKCSVSDSVNNGDDELNDSSGSNSSVTLSPYQEGTRRRPWMDHLDDDDDHDVQMQEPLVHESDTDTLKASQDSFDRLKFPYDGRESDASTPVSSIFDDETDRGFEEALQLHINPSMSGYSGIGICFESIKEEPEDLTSSGSNPFLDDISNENELFKTHAVVSKGSDSRASSRSSTSISENPFSSSHGDSPPRDGVFHPGNNTPIVITTGTDFDFGDSGFTSAVDQINTSDSSNQQEIHISGKLSPWPDSDENIKDSDLSFESDFSQNSNTDQIVSHGNAPKENRPIVSIKETRTGDKKPTKSAKPTNIKKGESHSKPIKPAKPVRFSQTAKKPINISVGEIKASERRLPARAKSFEETSPGKSKRSTIARSGSVEEPKPNIKPAYF